MNATPEPCPSVWCCLFLSPLAHPSEPWGIDVPGYREAPGELCRECYERLAGLLSQVPGTEATIPNPGGQSCPATP